MLSKKNDLGWSLLSSYIMDSRSDGEIELIAIVAVSLVTKKEKSQCQCLNEIGCMIVCLSVCANECDCG